MNGTRLGSMYKLSAHLLYASAGLFCETSRMQEASIVDGLERKFNAGWHRLDVRVRPL